MSNRNRKIRKAITKGIAADPQLAANLPADVLRSLPFSKPQKTGTPLHERSYLTQPVPGPNGTKHYGLPRTRSVKKAARYLAARVSPKAGA